MLDSLVALISQVNITASYRSTAFDYVTTPGGPEQGMEFDFFLNNGLGTANTALITNAGTVTNAKITITMKEGSESNFTNVSNTRILLQRTLQVGTGTTIMQALSLPVEMTQEFLCCEVNPDASVSLIGANLFQMTGRKAATG